MVGLGTYPGMLGASNYSTAWDDDYEMRRARTPVPEWLHNAISIHLGKIYGQKVARKGPPEVEDWWRDVNNGGMPIDAWMEEVVAPLLMVLGCLDICFDRPQLPKGTQIYSRADEALYGLDRVCASIILPENMLDWRRDNAGNYLECTVREYMDLSRASLEGGLSDGSVPEFGDGQQWIHDSFVVRYWTEDSWTLYKGDGEILDGPTRHGYGFVPIKRFVDLPRHRTPEIGKSRYEAMFEQMREYYNRNSELILSDTLQAHPFLSGPAELCKGDNTVSIGPGYVLPIHWNEQAQVYQGWEYVTPPKDPAESLRKNMQAIRDEGDRHASLTKPAGTPGTTGGTVAQSGISKELDAYSGNMQLTGIAKALARVERQVVEFEEACRTRRRAIPPAERAAIQVTYPARFQLETTGSLLNYMIQLQQVNAMLNGAPVPQQPAPPTNADGEARPVEPMSPEEMRRAMMMPQVSPTLTLHLLMDIALSVMVGHSSAQIDQVNREAAGFLKVAQAITPGITDDTEALEGAGTAEQPLAQDPTGEAGATMVSPGAPVVV
jgi:hypothetical protein